MGLHFNFCIFWYFIFQKHFHLRDTNPKRIVYYKHGRWVCSGGFVQFCESFVVLNYFAWCLMN